MNSKISFKNNSSSKIFTSPKAGVNAVGMRLYNLGCVYMDVGNNLLRQKNTLYK